MWHKDCVPHMADTKTQEEFSEACFFIPPAGLW